MKNLSTIKSKLLVLSVMTLTLLSACKKDEDNDNTTPGNVVNFTTTVLSDGTIQVEEVQIKTTLLTTLKIPVKRICLCR